MEGYEMMGDPGTSDTTVLELPRPWRDSFFPNSPMPAHEPSAPSSSLALHSRPPPYLPFDHHRAASFRHDGSEEVRNQAGQPASGSLIGHFQTDYSVGLLTSTRVLEDVLLTYPRGEGDAVTITTTDVEGLGPGKLVSDNIIDFYIKHLNREIVSRDSKKQQRIRFLSSFFFTKYLKSTEFEGRILREDDYVQLQRWIRDAKLLRRITFSFQLFKGEMDGLFCILHLDPMKGVHECFEVKSKDFYIMHISKHSKVPQQGNDYDCGMYILHYIEVFSKWTSGDPSFPLCQGGDHFTNPNFGMEVSQKRSWVQSLILELSGKTQELDCNPSNIQEKPQEDVGVVQQLRAQRNCSRSHAKETKSRKFTQEETSILLHCMLNIGRLGIKDKQGCMQRDLISQEINKCNGECSKSDDQCRRRFDTLLKAYNKLDIFCKKNDKMFGEITDIEKENMNLATPFKKENKAWFNDLRTICCQRPSSKGKPVKRQKLENDDDIDINKLESSHLDLVVPRLMPSEPTRIVHPKKAASNQVAIPGFGDLDIELKCTLLNMIQTCSMNIWRTYWEPTAEIGMLEEMCRMLAIVQDQNPLAIYKHVYELRDLELVTMVNCPKIIKDMVEWKDYQGIYLSCLKVFKKFGEKVLRKNPNLRTFQIACGDVFVTTVFPLQQIRVLTLLNCQELEHVDLGTFLSCAFFTLIGVKI